jgi:flagellar basal body-associated protein FliL
MTKKKKLETKNETSEEKNTKQKSFFSMPKIIALVLLALVIIVTIVILTQSKPTIEPTPTPVNTSSKPVVEEVKPIIQNATKSYTLTADEQLLVEAIDKKRTSYRVAPIRVNLNLSELCKEFLDTELSEGLAIAQNKYSQEFKMMDELQVETLYRYRFNIPITQDLVSSIEEKMLMSNLHNDKISSIGFAIVTKDKTNNVLIYIS